MASNHLRKFRITLWACVLIAFTGLGYLVIQMPFPLGSTKSSSVGGPFDMVDQNGQPVSEKTYLGRPMALFFGFTYCPDICPTTLARLSALLGKLPPDTANKIQVILVSVDPERDTPEALKAYLSAFDERFIGLTGTAKQLSQFAKSYRAFYEKVSDATGGYTMNHSAGVYLFDASGNFFGILSSDTDDAAAVSKLSELVEQ
jgi:protein SCO1/2